MLLVWLLGLGVGVANACQVPALNAAGGAGAASVAATSAALAHHAGLAHADAAGDGSPQAGHCQAFCDRTGVSSPPLKSVLDDVQAAALAAPTPTTLQPVDALAPDRRPWPPRLEIASPPIPIAFLRLAL